MLKSPLPSVLRSERRGRAFPPSPEMELLLCCARIRLQPAHVARIRELVQEGQDWERLLYLAGQRHKLLPLLYSHLNEHAQRDTPEAVLKSLRLAFVENTAEMLRLAGELTNLLRLFEQNDILAVPYKGPVLASELYGNLTLRQAGDLDIVVRRRDVQRARDLLVARGYRPRFELSGASADFQLRSRYGEEFQHASGIRVELHWRFSNLDTAFPLDLDMLEPRLQAARLSGVGVLTFSPEDLLLILSVHGAKHQWDSLELICGIAELLRMTKAMDWPAVIARARELRSRRVLLLALRLAEELLHAPLPTFARQELETERRLDGLVRQVRRVLLDERLKAGTLRSISGDLFRLRLRDRLKDRIRFVAYRVATPSDPRAWSFVQVGNRVIPLHSLRRPMKLGRRLVASFKCQTSRSDKDRGRSNGPEL